MIHLIIPTLIVSTIAIVTSLIAIVLVLAQRWSTHKIEWKPLQVQDPFLVSDKETKEIDEDDGKILEEALNLQRKGNILETNNF